MSAAHASYMLQTRPCDDLFSVASAMKTNKELQDIIEKERKKNMGPSENIMNEMTRLKQELERLTLEKQAADERNRENQVEIKRLQVSIG